MGHEAPDNAAAAPPLAGVKYADLLSRHLARLRGAYAHGNRVLFYDDLVTAYLLAFFNPTARSLRAIEDLSQTPAMRGRVGPARLCRSTLSDAAARFDPRLLAPLVGRLRARLPDLRRRDGDLARLLDAVTVVDGSFFAAAADVAWALTRRHGRGDATGPPRAKVRLDLHPDGRTLTPRVLAVSGEGAADSEPRSAARLVERGAVYVCDRGYASLAWVGAVLAGGADLVLRLTDRANFAARTDQAPDADDRAAGVVRDRVGRLAGSPHCRPPADELREVVAADPARPADAPPVRLLTSLLDVPARVVAALYRERWQVELFFRWLKVHAHFRHLTSHSRGGMTLGFHVAVIAVLLMYLHAGRPVSKYAYTLLAVAAAGGADVADVLRVLEARERERENDRRTAAARTARRAAEKTGK